MSQLLALLLVSSPIILVSMACVPNSWANSRSVLFRKIINFIAAIQFVVAGCSALALAAGWVPNLHVDLFSPSSEFSIPLTIFFDGVSALMLTLVSFIGWVICQYSIRYLDGEATQGRYFRWTSFTIGSVSLMVLSGNLLVFIVAWVMTSLGLHQLLLHYGHRRAAQRAAWTKFTVSRLGDVALIVATMILYSRFKTLEFAQLFQLVGGLTSIPVELHVASFLLVLGAVTKSAQVPFHSWLPQTMETPTPVSALMHAGIVNAGGYLMIRISPLIAISPWALTTLAVIGGVTACYAAVVMLTQTSIKKSLAYSTIAQMGFMLLQCGLGAYSAAMLHILAHSLYKAHAFLSSGSVITAWAAARGSAPLAQPVSWIKLAAAAAMTVAFLGFAFTVFGINPTTKPGGLLLGGIFCLALTHWIGQVMRSGNQAVLIRAMCVATGLCLVYAASFVAVDAFIASSLPTASGPEMFWLVAVVVLAGFCVMLAIQVSLASGRGSKILGDFHIHASNGFYLDSALRRVFGPLLNT